MSPRAAPPLWLLAPLAALPPVALNLFLPSLPAMARDLAAPPAALSAALSLYLAATAAAYLTLGPLSDRHGRRPVLLAALAIFAVGSALCAVATSLEQLLAGRLLQATAAAGYILSLAAIRDTERGPAATERIALLSMAMAGAPMLAPAVGGALDAAVGWRAVFGLYAAAGAALALFCWRRFPETRRAADAGGGWPRRAAYAALLGTGRFWAAALCAAFSVSGFYAFLAGAPIIAATRLELSAQATGIALGSITLGFLAGGWIASRAARRGATSAPLLWGRVLALAGPLGGLALWGLGVETAASVFGATLFIGLGNGLTMPQASAAAIGVRPDLAGAAAGVFGAMIVAVGAVATALAGLLTAGPEPTPALFALLAILSAAALAAGVVLVQGR